MRTTEDQDADNEVGRQETGDLLIAEAELKRRNSESTKRVQQHEEELCLLKEIQASLSSEENILTQRLASAQEERDRLSHSVDSMTRRSLELDGEIAESQRETVLLDQRYAEVRSRELELTEEISAAEKNIAEARKEIATITGELEMDRSILARIDQKLSLGRLKRHDPGGADNKE